MTGPYLFIRNFQRFLHYANRKPIWLKVHTLFKQDWSDLGLSDAQRGQLMSLVLTAAEENNRLPTDVAKLRELAHITGELSLSWLIEKGYIGCSDVSMLPELMKARAKPEPAKGTTDTVPQQQIIDLYHATCPDLPKVKAWHRQRQQLLACRWKEDEKRQSLDYWGKFFAAVKQSDFLYGRTSTGFRASLEWLLRPTNFAKVIEGNYHGKPD